MWAFIKNNRSFAVLHPFNGFAAFGTAAGNKAAEIK